MAKNNSAQITDLDALKQAVNGETTEAVNTNDGQDTPKTGNSEQIPAGPLANVDHAPDLPPVNADEFRLNLDNFRRHTVDGMTAARKVADAAIIHFAKTGDLVYCQQILDIMEKEGKNYVRKTAFLAWLKFHSPVTMDAGKLKKDKAADAVPFNLQDALDTSFWDFMPDKEAISWGYNDIVVQLKRIVDKAKDPKKVHLASDKAEKLLGEVEKFVVGL